MKHKTAELEDANLDAAVALALGWKRSKGDIPDWWVSPDGALSVQEWHPSTDGRQGVTIMEREHISLLTVNVNWGTAPRAWAANVLGMPAPAAYGRTMLEAGMRAFVASKLGDEVELP